LKDLIENKPNFHKRDKKIKIKGIRIETPKTKSTNIYLLGEERENKEKKK